MRIVFDIANPSQVVTDDEIKTTVCAILCHEILVGRHIPSIVNLKMVKHPIRRNGRYRSGELKYVIGEPDNHLIRVMYHQRTKSEILISVFHEVMHLVRLHNGDNNLDLEQEEQENIAQMGKIYNVVEWVHLVLLGYLEGHLKRPYGET